MCLRRLGQGAAFHHQQLCSGWWGERQGLVQRSVAVARCLFRIGITLCELLVSEGLLGRYRSGGGTWGCQRQNTEIVGLETD